MKFNFTKPLHVWINGGVVGAGDARGHVVNEWDWPEVKVGGGWGGAGSSVRPVGEAGQPVPAPMQYTLVTVPQRSVHICAETYLKVRRGMNSNTSLYIYIVYIYKFKDVQIPLVALVVL